MSEYKIHNFVTGKDETLPKHDPNEPTNQWIEGWLAGMSEYIKVQTNPYEQGTTEWHEWDDGWNEANND